MIAIMKIRTMQLLPLVICTIISFSSCNSAEPEQEESYPIIPAVNAYSFRGLPTAKDERNNEQVYTLFNLLDWCADKGIKALDPTAYFFPTYPV